MKSALLLSALLAAVAAQVAGGRIYDEKGDAVAEIEGKFKEVQTQYDNVKVGIEREGQTIKDDKVAQVKIDGKKHVETKNGTLSIEVMAAARTAIAKGKPIGAIDCIARVHNEEGTTLVESLETYYKDVDDIVGEKKFNLVVARYEADLIFRAVTELKDESVKKINAEKDDKVAGLRADAMKKLRSGENRLSDIDSRMHEPNIEVEFKKTRDAYKRKADQMLENAKKKLQKCVA